MKIRRPFILLAFFISTTAFAAEVEKICKDQLLQIGSAVGYESPQLLFRSKYDGTIFKTYDAYIASESTRAFKQGERKYYSDIDVETRRAQYDQKQAALSELLQKEADPELFKLNQDQKTLKAQIKKVYGDDYLADIKTLDLGCARVPEAKRSKDKVCKALHAEDSRRKDYVRQTDKLDKNIADIKKAYSIERPVNETPGYKKILNAKKALELIAQMEALAYRNDTKNKKIEYANDQLEILVFAKANESKVVEFVQSEDSKKVKSLVVARKLEADAIKLSAARPDLKSLSETAAALGVERVVAEKKYETAVAHQPPFLSAEMNVNWSTIADARSDKANLVGLNSSCEFFNASKGRITNQPIEDDCVVKNDDICRDNKSVNKLVVVAPPEPPQPNIFRRTYDKATKQMGTNPLKSKK